MLVSAEIAFRRPKIPSMIRRVQDDFHPQQAMVVKFRMQFPEFEMRSAGVQALRVGLQMKAEGLLKQSEGLLMQSHALQTFLVSFNEQFASVRALSI